MALPHPDKLLDEAAQRIKDGETLRSAAKALRVDEIGLMRALRSRRPGALPPPKRITDDMMDEAITRMSERGETLPQIAEALGVSHSGLWRALRAKRQDVLPQVDQMVGRRRLITPDVMHEVRALIANGSSIKDAAASVGFSPSAISNALRERRYS